jgi:hypothetical protein
MRDLPAAGERLQIGRVLENSFGLLFRNLPKYFLISAVGALPALIDSFDVAHDTGATRRLGGLLLVGLAEVMLNGIFQSIMVYGAFQDMRGRGFDLGESVRQGLNRLFPVVGVAISFALIVILGLMLAVVPAFIFISMFALAIPVCVVERLGPIRSLDRSSELTKGNRWRFLSMYVVILVAFIIGGSLAPRIGLLVGGFLGRAILVYLLAICQILYLSMVNILAYRDLRIANEGVDIERIAAVFD